MRQSLQIVGGFYADADRHWSAQDCVNRLPMQAERGGTRSPFILRDCPGLRPFVDIYTRNMVPGDPPTEGAAVTYGSVRGMRNVEGREFAVAGTQLFQITPALVCIPRGTVPGVSRVSIAHNQNAGGHQVAIANGTSGYVYHDTLETFQKITDPGLPGVCVFFYIDSYIGFVEAFGRYWGWSDLASALEYNTLDRAEAEADPDRIVTAFVSHREVLIFGKDTIEPFINTGSETGTFRRAENTVIECGCSAKFSVAGMDNSVFWLDDKRIVRRLDGYTPARISTVGIEQALAECTQQEISSAYAFTWEDRGHKVYYLTVPHRFTFGYDLLSGEWHRRKSYGRPDWRLTSLNFWNDQWVGGDRDGKLYVLDWDYHYDGVDPHERIRVSGVLSANQAPIIVNEVELVYGVGGPASVPVDFPEQPLGPGLAGFGYSLTVGVAADDTITTAEVGDHPLVRYAVVDGTLPAGVTLSTAGVIAGTPTTAGESVVTIRVTDSVGLWAEAEFTFTVEAEE